MHVLMTTLGSIGDLFPVLGLGRALQQRGHRVEVIALPSFEAEIKDSGLGYVELQLDEGLVAAAGDALAQAFRRDYGVELPGLAQHLLDPNLPQIFYENLESRIEAGEVDETSFVNLLMKLPACQRLLRSIPERIYHTIEEHRTPGDTVWASLPWYTGGIAGTVQDKLGVPAVSIWINAKECKLVQPVLPGAFSGAEDWVRNLLVKMLVPGALNELNALRNRAGLPAESNLVRAWFFSQRLNLCLFPSWYVDGFKGRLPACEFVGFSLYQKVRSLPPELEEFLAEGPPPVVFGNASWRPYLKNIIDVSLEACDALGLRAVFVSKMAPRFVERSKNAIGVAYADYQTLLPRSRAVVHHGGIGSVAAALASGTPQLAVPWVNDQGFNAATVVRLGAGLSVKSAEFAKQAQPLLRELLSRPEIASKSQELAARLKGSPDFSRAIEHIEAMLERAPVG